MSKAKQESKKAKQRYGYPVRPLRFPIAIRSVVQAMLTFSIYSVLIWVLLSQKSAVDRLTFEVNNAIERTALATETLDIALLEALPFDLESRENSDFLIKFREKLLRNSYTDGGDNIDLSLIVKKDGDWVHYLSTRRDWIDQPWEEGGFVEELLPGYVFGNMMDEDSFREQRVTSARMEDFAANDQIEFAYIQFQVADRLDDFFIRNGRSRQYDFSDFRLVYLVVPDRESPILFDQAVFIGKYLLLSFVLILPVIVFASYRLTSRSRVLRDTIVRIAKGDASARISIPGKDEVGQLSDHINGLAMALEERQKLRIDVDLASRLQKDLLPPEPPCPGEVGLQIAQANRMSNDVGGDFFDYICDGKRLYIVIGDISGHGLESGLMMAASRTAIRIYLEMELQPAALAERLNHQLYEDLIHGHFLTAAILHINLETGDWWHLSCGHEPTIVRENGQLRQLGTTCPPLGMFPTMNVKKEAERGKLEHGDMMLLTTDGLRECANLQDVQLGQSYMREELAISSEPQDLVNKLVEKAHSHRAPLPIEDDVTIVAIRRPPEK